ncbi:PilZ domain-containing protein [Croceicoccus ponticola]|uniref:PilZ domain-containing protein n=1 Tax=Croceicoccus ponticola TaxID=2217664 RepID=A0A437H202_9SPHN|nr:PilZ domain-containing protein [Croceicoccus ponticola]RVQ69619.1 PilZ domain-containing protein [Croceicoccus ponticola]
MTRRDNERLDSDRLVDCRMDGRSFKAVLYNVSVTGCMIEMEFNQVGEGDRLFLKAEGNIRLSGLVVWQNERNAGVRFDDPLHEAVVRFLGYDPVRSALEPPTDRFGRLLPKLPRSDPAYNK